MPHSPLISLAGDALENSDWYFSEVSFFFSCEVIEIEHRHSYCPEVFMISKLRNWYFYRYQMTDFWGACVISSLIALCRGSPPCFHVGALAVMEALTGAG